jgi:hypothetical protein
MKLVGTSPLGRSVFFVLLGLSLAAGCKQGSGKKTTETAATASASSVATPSAPTPGGSRGAVAGTIRVKGDPAPLIASIVPKIPLGKCFAAHETYSKLFREGPGRTLGDVLVAVTNYQGEAPKAADKVTLQANDCAYDRRTVALSLGQSVSVKNNGGETYTPQLLGLPSQALLLAIPGGEPIDFKPHKLGQYQLIDRTHPFIFTDVFVMRYSTVDVTDIDGKYEIQDLPSGPAELSALLPITGQATTLKIQIPPGGTAHHDLVIEYLDARDGGKARVLPDGASTASTSSAASSSAASSSAAP